LDAGFLLQPVEKGFDWLAGSGNGGGQALVGSVEVFLALGFFIPDISSF